MPIISTRGVASARGFGLFNKALVIDIPNIGDPFQGGYYAGVMNPEGSSLMYAIVISPKAQGQTSALQWVNSGGLSRWDGAGNTAIGDTSDANSFVRGLSINGFSDWYIPAIDELELLYRNLKPTTVTNIVGAGANSNSLPRNSGYTTSYPAQTPLTPFKVGGAECLDSSTATWSSTMLDSSGQFMYFQQHNDGDINGARAAANSLVVRAIRRYIISQ